MEDIKHLLSESATWETSSSFVDGEGNVSSGKGESQIIIAEEYLLNQSRTITGKRKLVNNYTKSIKQPRSGYITPLSPQKKLHIRVL